MINEFKDFQNKTSQWGNKLSNMRPEAVDRPDDLDFSSWERLELRETPDILRKSIERFLIGNVI